MYETSLFLLFIKGLIVHIRLTDPGGQGIQILPVLVRYYSIFHFCEQSCHLFLRLLCKRFDFSLQTFETHNRNKIAVDVFSCTVQLFKITLFSTVDHTFFKCTYFHKFNTYCYFYMLWQSFNFVIGMRLFVSDYNTLNIMYVMNIIWDFSTSGAW